MPIFGVHPDHLLETIFDQVSIAVMVVDEERRIAYANDPALQIFGLSRATLAHPLRVEDLSVYHFFDSSGHFRLAPPVDHIRLPRSQPQGRALRLPAYWS